MTGERETMQPIRQAICKRSAETAYARGPTLIRPWESHGAGTPRQTLPRDRQFPLSASCAFPAVFTA